MVKKVLLYSGGMDSWLISKIWNPDIKLYIDINSSYSKEEIKRLPKDVVLENLDLSKWEREDKIIPLRNLFFAMIGSFYGDEICLGATAGDRVLDKSPEFAKMSSQLLSFLYSKQHWTDERSIRINVDFKNNSKTMLVKKYKENGGDLDEAFNESFSCYCPDDKGNECWNCKPCFRKWVAFKNNGYNCPKEFEDKVVYYIEKEILPLIVSGNYGRAQEEQEILNALDLVKNK